MKKIIKMLLAASAISVYAGVTHAAGINHSFNADCLDSSRLSLSEGAGGVFSVNILDNNSNWTVSYSNIDFTGNIVASGGGSSAGGINCSYTVKNDKGEDQGRFTLQKDNVLFTTLRVCNFYTDTVIWRAVSTGKIKSVLTNNDVALAPSDGSNGKCGDISLRLPLDGDVGKVLLSYVRPKYNNKGAVDIGGVINDKVEGHDVAKIMSITNVTRMPAGNRDVLSVYARPNNGEIIEQQGRTLLYPGAQSTTIKRISNSAADFTICIGDKANNKCSDTAFAQ